MSMITAIESDYLVGDRLLRAKEVARILNLSVRLVWRLRESGRLPAVKLSGGSTRWKASTVRAYLEKLEP